MNKNPEFNKKVEEALESLEGIQRASPGPYFLTRVKARLQREDKDTVWDIISGFLSKPVIAFACLFLILFINAGVFYRESHKTGQAISNPTVSLDEEDYNIGIATLYEYNN